MSVMRFVFLVVVGSFFSTAHAAQIYGTLTEGKRAVAGLQITVTCNSGGVFETQTNDSGSYSLRVGATGFCQFIVTNRTGPPSIEIYLYDQPSRYDFNLTRDSDGTYALKKR